MRRIDTSYYTDKGAPEGARAAHRGVTLAGAVGKAKERESSRAVGGKSTPAQRVILGGTVADRLRDGVSAAAGVKRSNSAHQDSPILLVNAHVGQYERSYVMQ